MNAALPGHVSCRRRSVTGQRRTWFRAYSATSAQIASVAAEREAEQLVDLASGAPRGPLLLDKIFHGTNQHSGIGSEAVVRGLLDRGAIGLVTTHDLAIAGVADGQHDRAANVHFEDQLSDGRMTFDYRVRRGVVTKSNALELMGAVGLEV